MFQFLFYYDHSVGLWDWDSMRENGRERLVLESTGDGDLNSGN